KPEIFLEATHILHYTRVRLAVPALVAVIEHTHPDAWSIDDLDEMFHKRDLPVPMIPCTPTDPASVKQTLLPLAKLIPNDTGMAQVAAKFAGSRDGIFRGKDAV